MAVTVPSSIMLHLPDAVRHRGGVYFRSPHDVMSEESTDGWKVFQRGIKRSNSAFLGGGYDRLDGNA